MSGRPVLHLMLAVAVAAALAACGADEKPAPPLAAPPAAERAPQPAAAAPAPAAPATPDSLPNGLVLALAQFVTEEGKPVPGPARLEFVYRRDGRWQTSFVEDEESNVFHKAMFYEGPDGRRILTLAGTAATVKTWEKGASGLEPTTWWQEDFGGKWSRMRDAEVADLYGDGAASIAVATHDQGVVAVLRPRAEGGFDVIRLDEKPDTFVHEIEVGDLDGDGVLEVYATPSEPNRMDGSRQTGEVVRYVPAKKEGRVVVADLGERHAKEILVDDVDGDGHDELYVSVEGHLEGEGASKRLVDPVEILRYDADTPAGDGVVIGSLKDSLSRFLTSGDVDGDGKKELVVAAFSSGLWLYRPGADPKGRWQRELIDKDSAGFEHASILADLDGDGVDELYVASDRHKELRRYVWNGEKLAREVIYVRPDDRPIFTWNLMPLPVDLIP
jgi:predicted small lipoprotein YifL